VTTKKVKDNAFPPAPSFVVIVRSRVADPDPDSIGSVDPDSESGSGSRRGKMTHKSRKKIKVNVLKC
jgi:hypothetical protein